MSYNYTFNNGQEPYQEPPPARGISGIGLGMLLGIALMTAAAAYLFPVLHKQWNEFDRDTILKTREVEARAEAESRFRIREAELKANASHATERLDKAEIVPTAFSIVAEKTGPAVVNISNLALENGLPVKRGEGSGVVVKVEKDVDGLQVGHIITNSHVIRKEPRNLASDVADQIGITFSSGRTIFVESNSVFHDPFFDLAIIKFDASDFDHLVVAEFADSNTIGVGDWVVAIGSPFGLKQSVTAGIISAKGRTELHRIIETEVLQTDAAINVGNSGGPLIDLKGRVVGINTAIFSPTGSNTGIGFSIPSNTVKEVTDTLLKPPHRIIRGYLGVGPADLDPRIAIRAKLKGGAVIGRVQPNSPASVAGLEVNDVVTKFRYKGKEREVLKADDLRAFIREVKPGETADLEVVRGLAVRGGSPDRRIFEVTMAELPRDIEFGAPQEPNPGQNPFRNLPPNQSPRRR